MTSSIGDVLQRAKRPEHVLKLCLVPHLVDEQKRLARDVAAADSMSDPRSARLAELDTEIEQGTLELTLRALPAREYDELTLAHPPREGVAEDQQDGVNGSTFYPALARASIAAPEITDAEWNMLPDVLTHGEQLRILTTALTINKHDGSVIPFSSGASAKRPSSARKSRRRAK